MFLYDQPVSKYSWQASQNVNIKANQQVYGLNSEDFLPVATTRPETLLGDTAVAVNPEVCPQFMVTRFCARS